MKRVLSLIHLVGLFFFIVSAPHAIAAEEGTGTRLQETRVEAPRLLVLDLAARSDVILAVGDRGTILRSTDQGTSWLAVPSSVEGMLTAVSAFGNKSFVAVGHDATILVSSDEGLTWSISSQDPEQEPLFDVHFISESHGIAVGAYGLVLETKDSGRTWIQRSIESDDRHIYGIAALPSNELFLAGESGLLMTSEDGGSTWKNISIPYSGSLFGICSIADSTVFTVGLRGHALYSRDKGKSWLSSQVPTTASLTACTQFLGAPLIVGLSGIVLVSPGIEKSPILIDTKDRKAITSVLALNGNDLILTGEFGIRKITVD